MMAREQNLEIGLGFCLPASCSTHKVLEYSNKILIEANLQAFDAVCRTNDPIKPNGIDIFAL